MNGVKKKKGIEAKRANHPTPSQATDALIGDEEQNGKQENKIKEKERIQNPTTLDHSVTPYDAQDHIVSLFFLPAPLTSRY